MKEKVSSKREQCDARIDIAEREKARHQGKVYISGAISKVPLDEAVRRFGQAEAELHQQGFRTCNPLRMSLCVFLASHGHYRLCLLLQLAWLWMTCDCIYLLDGWHLSDGARLERAAARVLGLTMMYEKINTI